MIKQSKLIAYALDLVSYIVSKEIKINTIILHGSITRDDFNEESDIDLFIDSNESKKIKKIIDNFYKTKKFKEWELKGITNEFSAIIGKLNSNEWKDLKRSIINNGIILYGKYNAETEKTNNYTLFSFENIKPNKKRVLVHRYLFGFKVGKKSYDGFSKKINAIKIGKGALLVPLEHTNELKKYFQNKKVKVKLYDLSSDTKFMD